MNKGLLALLLVVALLAGSIDAYGRAKGKNKRPQSVFRTENLQAPLLKKEQLPKEFNWGNVGGKSFLAPSWNQHIPQYCGSCFLHASLSVVQDRIKIMQNAKFTDVMLARQVFLNCAPFQNFSDGCEGGDAYEVFEYMRLHGLPDETCQPYKAADYTQYGNDAKDCPAMGRCMNCMPINGTYQCWPVENPVMYKVKEYGSIKGGVEGIMSEIYHRGPVVCGVAATDDLVYNYRGGIYEDKTNNTDVDHDVELVGW
eukprot:Colp12_sorted_trinity150504_noHs@5723